MQEREREIYTIEGSEVVDGARMYNVGIKESLNVKRGSHIWYIGARVILSKAA